MTLHSTEGHEANLPESLSPTLGGALRGLARLAVPVMITQVSMMAMGLVDTILVGPLGSEPLAAVAVANAVFFAIVVFGMGVITALDPLVSQAIGGHRKGRAGDYLWQGAWLALAIGVAMTALFLDSAWLFHLLEQPPVVADLAGDYLAARSWGVVPFMLFAAGRGLLNGVGDTRPVMVIAILANVVNVFFDLGLIQGRFGMPALGVVGAGVATSAVRWFMLAAIVAVLLRARYRHLGLAPRWPDLMDQRRILRLGLPIGGQLSLEVGLFAAMGVFAGWLGTESLAAHQIAMSIASLTFMVPLGLSIAATVQVGQAVGARQPDLAAYAGKVALGSSAGIMAVNAAVFVAIPGPLASVFSPEPPVLEAAVSLILIAAVFQLSDGVQVVSAGCLRGAGDARTPFLTNLVVHWAVGIPAAWLMAFPGGLGVDGLWWGLTLSLTGVAIVQTSLFLRGGWRTLTPLD